MFLRCDWFYVLINLKSFYELYLPLYTLFLIVFFNYRIRNQLSSSTATSDTPVVSDNTKWRKLFLGFDYFHSFYLHKVIVRVLLTIIYIISYLIFQTSDEKSTLRGHCYTPNIYLTWTIAVSAESRFCIRCLKY